MKKYLLVFLCIWSNCFSIEKVFLDSSVDTELVKKAWGMLGSKKTGYNKSYYSFTLNESFFAGARPWHVRWNNIKNALNWDNKMVLDLGCNIGLNLIFLKKYTNIKNCVGVDAPDCINIPEKSLYSNLMDVVPILQEAFHLQFPIMQIDLSNDPYEELLGTNFDVVFCMSVFHWIKDKERLLQFLSRFPHVIYEGHWQDQKTIQGHIDLFKKKGFFQYEILNTSPNDFKRYLIHFWK